MKFGTKGIGWLIAGALVCVSAFPGDSIASVLSTVAIGLTFIAVYVMKQRFSPVAIAWFIAGGILIAFCVDCLFEMTAGVFSGSGADAGGLSDMLIGAICAFGCMFMFYRRNTKAMADAADSKDEEFTYQETVVREETTTVETTQTVTPAEDKTEVEFEVSDDK